MQMPQMETPSSRCHRGKLGKRPAAESPVNAGCRSVPAELGQAETLPFLTAHGAGHRPGLGAQGSRAGAAQALLECSVQGEAVTPEGTHAGDTKGCLTRTNQGNVWRHVTLSGDLVGRGR